MAEQQDPATRADLDRLAAFVRELDRMLHLATARPQGDHRLPPAVLPPLPRPAPGGPGAARTDPGWMPTRTSAPAGLPEPGIAWVEPVGAAVARTREAAVPAPADTGDRSRPGPALDAVRVLGQPTLATGPVPAEPQPQPQPPSEGVTEPGRPRPATGQVAAQTAGGTAPALPPAVQPRRARHDAELSGEGAPAVAPPTPTTTPAPVDRPPGRPVPAPAEPRPGAPESSATASAVGHRGVGSPGRPQSVPPSSPGVVGPGPGRSMGVVTDHPGVVPSSTELVDGPGDGSGDRSGGGSGDGHDDGLNYGPDDGPDDAAVDRSDGPLADPLGDEWEPGPEQLPVAPASVPGPLRGAPGPRRSAVPLTAGEAERVRAGLERSYLDRTLRRSR